MSVFGTGIPKIALHASPYTETSLDNARILRDEPENEYLVHISVINGHKEIVFKGTHWFFDVGIHIFKTGDAAANLAKYQALAQLVGTKFKIYRHSDFANPITDGAGTAIAFMLYEKIETYYQTTAYHDYLILKFMSTDYVSMYKTSVITPHKEKEWQEY